MDREGFQRWLDGYVDAWKTYDEGKIGALFSADAEYRYSPQDEPLKGRDAIVNSWTENKDDPGTYDAKYEVLAIDGDTYVANGWSRYFKDGKLDNEFFNIYICHFNDAGECTSFTEYWMQNREFRKRDREDLMRQVASGEVSAPPAPVAA